MLWKDREAEVTWAQLPVVLTVAKACLWGGQGRCLLGRGRVLEAVGGGGHSWGRGSKPRSSPSTPWFLLPLGILTHSLSTVTLQP